MIAYFAYGTTQQGFAHHRRLAGVLGERAGRFRTVAPHAVVVPRRAACSNPGCSLVHRMAMLVPGFAPLHAEGDVFVVSAEAIAELDRLETGGPYFRATVAIAAVDGAETRSAQAYLTRDPAAWRALVARGDADALPAYPRELAAVEDPKDCCIRRPGHGGPHDVIDPLAPR